jgi:2-oxoglutarate ferredoxin oxidoreductase subunit delta
MAKIKGTITVNTERCKGCEICISACPTNVLGMTKEVNKKGYNYAYMLREDDCIGCASCGLVCPDGCITVYKMKNEK